MPDKLTVAQSLQLLTDKQRDVLELLIEHKTSKEISRELGISPHTVDQRLDAVRNKLGAKNRSEIAQIYRRLKEADVAAPTTASGTPGGGEAGYVDGIPPEAPESAISERMTYEKTLMVQPAFFTNEGFRNDAGSGASLFTGTLIRQGEARPDRGDVNPDVAGDDAETVQDYRVVPELFDGRYGTQARLLAIILIAAAFLVTALVGFSIVKSVSDALQG